MKHDFLTTDEAAAMLGIKRRQVHNLCKRGILKARRLGHYLCIDPKSMAAARQRRTLPGTIPGTKRKKKAS